MLCDIKKQPSAHLFLVKKLAPLIDALYNQKRRKIISFHLLQTAHPTPIRFLLLQAPKTFYSNTLITSPLHLHLNLHLISYFSNFRSTKDDKIILIVLIFVTQSISLRVGSSSRKNIFYQELFHIQKSNPNFLIKREASVS